MKAEDKTQRIERDGERAHRGALVSMWILFLVVAVVWLGKRDQEWDLLAYSACVVELGEGDPVAVHREVYAELDARVPAEVKSALRSKNEYRARMAEDPRAFAAQLPFYRGRVLYIGAIAGLAAVGVSPIDGAFWVSWLSGVALLVGLGLWLRARGRGGAGVVIGNLLALLAVGFWFKTPIRATPDALAAALLVWGAFLLLETRRVRLALVLLGLSLAARSDSVVLIAPLVGWCALGISGGARVSPRELATAAAGYAAVVLACTLGRATYGPWVVFHHTFVEYKAFPLEETPAFDLALWVKQSLRSLPKFKGVAPLLFTLAGLVAMITGYRRDRWRSPSLGLALVALLATLVHFALFPALWPRLMLPYWLLTALALGRGGRENEAPEADQSMSSQASP